MQEPHFIRASVGAAVHIGKCQRAIIFIVNIVQLEIGPEIIRRIPLHRRPTDEILETAISVYRGSACSNFHEFVDICELTRQTNAERITQWTRNITAERISIFFKFIGSLASDFPILGRVGRTDGKNASRRTFSEEQGLRTFQHIDLLDIKKTGLHNPHGADLYTIKIECHGGVKGGRDIGRANTAK